MDKEQIAEALASAKRTRDNLEEEQKKSKTKRIETGIARARKTGRGLDATARGRYTKEEDVKLFKAIVNWMRDNDRFTKPEKDMTKEDYKALVVEFAQARSGNGAISAQNTDDSYWPKGRLIEVAGVLPDRSIGSVLSHIRSTFVPYKRGRWDKEDETLLGELWQKINDQSNPECARFQSKWGRVQFVAKELNRNPITVAIKLANYTLDGKVIQTNNQPWTEDEDKKLIKYVRKIFGPEVSKSTPGFNALHNIWGTIATLLNTNRDAAACQRRFEMYLKSNSNRSTDNFTPEDDLDLLQAVKVCDWQSESDVSWTEAKGAMKRKDWRNGQLAARWRELKKKIDRWEREAETWEEVLAVLEDILKERLAQWEGLESLATEAIKEGTDVSEAGAAITTKTETQEEDKMDEDKNKTNNKSKKQKKSVKEEKKVKEAKKEIENVKEEDKMDEDKNNKNNKSKKQKKSVKREKKVEEVNKEIENMKEEKETEEVKKEVTNDEEKKPEEVKTENTDAKDDERMSSKGEKRKRDSIKQEGDQGVKKEKKKSKKKKKKQKTENAQ